MVRTRHNRWSRLSRFAIAGAVSLGASLWLAPLGAAGRSTAGQSPSAPHATVAKTTSLHETGRLHLTSKHNFTLNERGTATGTIAGQIYVHLTAVSSSRVTVEVNIYPHGGSVSGRGSGSYRRQGTVARFAGSMSFTRGTGNYAHVHGSNLSFSGTIEESNHDAITVHVSGRVSS